MEISKINSLVELYFKKSKEVDKKKIFLEWLRPQKQIYDWNDISKQILKLSIKIKSLIKSGDRCLILSENRPSWLISDIAIMNAGGISCLLYTSDAADE